jgi:hypothetical protein
MTSSERLAGSGPLPDSQRPTFSERLTVAWWAWPVGLAATAMLTAELAIGAFALRTPLTFAIAALLTACALLWLGRIRVRFGPDELRVDDATLPVWAIASATPLDAAGRRDLLGVDADPMAFVVLRSWIPGGVRIDLADPADPTPYWFVSTRHPERLADAVERARTRS